MSICEMMNQEHELAILKPAFRVCNTTRFSIERGESCHIKQGDQIAIAWVSDQNERLLQPASPPLIASVYPIQQMHATCTVIDLATG